MTQNLAFQIEPYTHTHDTGLATMWNESDQQWPGGFTRGVPMTAERVGDWMDKQTALLRLVITAPEGKVVGYGSLWDEPSQPGRSCYVDLLNVHPDYQGRSLCRRMLVQMVDYATNYGYQRMTLGTWAANLKAVPLYKKVGFHWKPNTTVSMENYIPALRQLPILRDFFAQSDWYAHHSRQLLQVEDNQQHPKTGATEVYLYRWTRPDGEWIEAVIDRKAQWLTGLETSTFAAFAHLSESKPAQGVSYPIHWEITNKRQMPMHVRLAANGDAYVQIDHLTDFVLGPGETRCVEASYCCAGDAPRLNISTWRPQPTPRVNTLIVLDVEELPLGSGVHYEAAAEISLHPQPVTLLPGLGQTVLVQVKNQLKRPIQGELQVVDSAGLTTDWQCANFSAPAQGYTSIPLQLTSSTEGEVALAIAARIADEERVIQTAPQALPVLVRTLGSVVAIEHRTDANKTTIFAENDFFFARFEQREGYSWLIDKADQKYHIGLHETLGPPFAPSEFDQKDFTLSLHKEAGRVRITSTITSSQFPGMMLGRELTITPSPLVEVRYWLQNAGEREHTCQVLTTLDFPDSFATNAQSALPRRERLVLGMANQLPELEGDFPKMPAGLAEQWGAFSMHGQVQGAIWSAEIAEHEWRPWYFDLISITKHIAVNERVTLRPLYLYCGPGDWRTVRRIWQQHNGQTQHEQLHNLVMPKAGAVQQVMLIPNPALTIGDNVTLQLSADNLRQQAIRGSLLLTPPAGWDADQQEFEVVDLQEGNAFATTIQLKAANPPPGVSIGEVLLETDGFDQRQPFTILRLGDASGKVHLRQERLSEQPIWQIDNGRMVWSVAPAYHAGIVAWHEHDSTINHLRSPFPTDGEFAWMKPWFGGIRPLLHYDDGGWPGKLHEERFAGCGVELTDGQGLRWQGLRLQAEILKQPKLKGIRVELDYLTLPGSHLLKAIYRLVNDTPVYRGAWDPAAAWMIFCQVDGEFDQTVLYGESPYIGPVQRKRTAYNQWHNVGHWAAAVNPNTGRALVITSPSHPESLMLIDAATRGGHLLVKQQKLLPPHSQHELVAYIALVDSLAEARHYEGLR